MKGTLLAITGLFCLINSVHAQPVQGKICAGPLVALRNPFGYGGQVEYRISEKFSAGAIGRYWAREKDFKTGKVSWSGSTAQAVFGYHVFRNYELDPYLVACVGWSESKETFDETIPEADRIPATYKGIALSAGMGLRYSFTEHLALNWSVDVFATDEKNFSKKLGANVGLEVVF